MSTTGLPYWVSLDNKVSRSNKAWLCVLVFATQAASGEGQDPIVWERTLGCNVWDVDGNRFVDLTAGFGVTAAGHCNPYLCAVAGKQMRTHMHGMGDAFPGKVLFSLVLSLKCSVPQSSYWSSAPTCLHKATSVTTDLQCLCNHSVTIA